MMFEIWQPQVETRCQYRGIRSYLPIFGSLNLDIIWIHHQIYQLDKIQNEKTTDYNAAVFINEYKRSSFYIIEAYETF